MQHRRKQRCLVLYPARPTQSRNQRFRFGKTDRRLNRTLRLRDDLRRQFPRIPKPNVARVKILRTETRCSTQRRTDNASTDIRGARIR